MPPLNNRLLVLEVADVKDPCRLEPSPSQPRKPVVLAAQALLPAPDSPPSSLLVFSTYSILQVVDSPNPSLSFSSSLSFHATRPAPTWWTKPPTPIKSPLHPSFSLQELCGLRCPTHSPPRQPSKWRLSEPFSQRWPPSFRLRSTRQSAWTGTPNSRTACCPR